MDIPGNQLWFLHAQVSPANLFWRKSTMAKRFCFENQNKKPPSKIFAAAFGEKQCVTMRCLATAVLADQSSKWCKARDRADNLRSRRAFVVQSDHPLLRCN